MRRRRRLVASIASFSLVGLGGAFVAVWLSNTHLQERQLDQALLHEAREEAREVGMAGGTRLMISARPGPQANDVGPLTKYAALYAANGKVLAQTGSFEGDAPLRPESKALRLARPFNMWHRAEHLRAVWAEVPTRKGLLLLLAAPRTDLDGDEAFLGRAMLLAFGVAFAWALAVSAWLVGRFTRGYELVANVAHTVALGDLSARVPASDQDTELEQLARDVNQMIERLGSLLSSHQHFIAHAAHELRSPLTALYGELSHALRRERDADTYRVMIAEALESTQRLRTLAEDLLALARMSSDADPEPKSPLRLDELLARVSLTVRNEADAKNVQLELHTQPACVVGRALDLERLFRNLFENAIQHAPSGTHVQVELARGSQHLVRIENQGPAIPDADLERLFEPFVRGANENAEGRSGSGLGLAIARRIALNHGGKLALSPGRPTGVELTVNLPKSQGEPPSS
ncbi:MAG: HAMP domain-containing sensor histidine kinase [Myxococcales bacterium]